MPRSFSPLASMSVAPVMLPTSLMPSPFMSMPPVKELGPVSAMIEAAVSVPMVKGGICHWGGSGRDGEKCMDIAFKPRLLLTAGVDVGSPSDRPDLCNAVAVVVKPPRHAQTTARDVGAAAGHRETTVEERRSSRGIDGGGRQSTWDMREERHECMVNPKKMQTSEKMLRASAHESVDATHHWL
jgi:hypothetical protein